MNELNTTTPIWAATADESPQLPSAPDYRRWFLQAPEAWSELEQRQHDTVVWFEVQSRRARLLLDMAAKRPPKTTTRACPCDEVWRRFAASRLPLMIALDVAMHLSHCEDCARVGRTGDELDRLETEANSRIQSLDEQAVRAAITPRIRETQKKVEEAQRKKLIGPDLFVPRTIRTLATCAVQEEVGADGKERTPHASAPLDARQTLLQETMRTISERRSKGIVVQEDVMGDGVSSVLRDVMVELLNRPLPQNVVVIPIDLLRVVWTDDVASSLRCVLSDSVRSAAPGIWGSGASATEEFENIAAAGVHCVIVASVMPSQVPPQYDDRVRRFVDEMLWLIRSGVEKKQHSLRTTILLGCVNMPDIFRQLFQPFVRQHPESASMFRLNQLNRGELLTLVRRRRTRSENASNGLWDWLEERVASVCNVNSDVLGQTMGASCVEAWDASPKDDEREADLVGQFKRRRPHTLMRTEATCSHEAYINIANSYVEAWDERQRWEKWPDWRDLCRFPTLHMARRDDDFIPNDLSHDLQVATVTMAAERVSRGCDLPVDLDQGLTVLKFALEGANKYQVSMKQQRDNLLRVELSGDLQYRYAFACSVRDMIFKDTFSLRGFTPKLWTAASVFRSPGCLSVADEIEGRLVQSTPLPVKSLCVALHIVTMARWSSKTQRVHYEVLRGKARGWFLDSMQTLRSLSTECPFDLLALVRECAVAYNLGPDRDPALLIELIQLIHQSRSCSNQMAEILVRYYHGYATALVRLVEHLQSHATASVQASLDLAEIWALTRKHAGAVAFRKVAREFRVDLVSMLRGIQHTGMLRIDNKSLRIEPLDGVRPMIHDLLHLLPQATSHGDA